MYGALWRVLPGPWPVKLLIALVVIAAVLYGLVFYAFPWADALLTPQNDVTVGLGIAGSSATLPS